MNFEINSLTELNSAAKALFTFADGEMIFVFKGEMGAGKTTFIKALCEELGVEDVVSSPTFSLVNEYAAGNSPVYHFDFYRIRDIREAYDIGYEEYFFSGHICLIEWPEKVEEILPELYIIVEIKVLAPDKRAFTFSKNYL
jgi:tRNA threonylcarbamoyladenosine biosynthesis protein TsaE